MTGTLHFAKCEFSQRLELNARYYRHYDKKVRPGPVYIKKIWTEAALNGNPTMNRLLAEGYTHLDLNESSDLFVKQEEDEDYNIFIEMLSSISPKKHEILDTTDITNEGILNIHPKMYTYRRRLKNQRYKFDKPYPWINIFEESADMLTNKLNGKDLLTECSGFARSKDC